MKTIRQIPILSFGLLICIRSLVSAQEPVPQTVDAMWGFKSTRPYTIIPRPANHSNKDDPNTARAPVHTIQSRPSQPYAYGWFGTKPAPQWSRQFGYQKAYTQWTLK